MTELEAMSRMEYFVRERGHIGIMRLRGYNQEVITGMLGAGDAAATPPISTVRRAGSACLLRVRKAPAAARSRRTNRS